jgi:hypothetical protein
MTRIWASAARAVAILLSAIMEFIAICAAAITSILTFCFGNSVFSAGYLGIKPNTNSEGTRPFSPIESFMAFTPSYRRVPAGMCG